MKKKKLLMFLITNAILTSTVTTNVFASNLLEFFSLGTVKTYDNVQDFENELVGVAMNNSENVVNIYSDDTNVATVDKNGNITAVGRGSTRINVVCQGASEGYRTISCAVDVEATHVTLDATGGAVESSVIDVVINRPYNTYQDLPVPTRTGYVFDGWFNDDNVKIEPTTIVTNADDHTLTAHWTEKPYDEITEKVSEYEYNINLPAGGSAKLSKLSKPSGKGATYRVSINKNVATIDAKGTIKAKKSGSCVATVEKDNAKYTLNINVSAPKFEQKKYYVNGGETVDISIKGTTLKPTYSVAKSSIVSVNEDGVATGLQYGSTNVTAKVGNKTYKTTIFVDNPKIYKEEVLILNRKVFKNKVVGTKSKTIEWKSDDTGVATVNKKGVITPVATGITDIHAVVNGKDLVCKVKVDMPVMAAEGISISVTKGVKATGSASVGSTFKLRMDATEATPSWNTKSSKFISLNSDGTVTANKKGKAVITTKINGTTYTYNINVR